MDSQSSWSEAVITHILVRGRQSKANAAGKTVMKTEQRGLKTSALKMAVIEATAQECGQSLEAGVVQAWVRWRACRGSSPALPTS